MPTIQQQINQLKKDKETLNTMLNTMGVETTGNETFTQLTPLVGKIVTNPILQDKTVEITENGTTSITADEGYNGLNSVQVTTSISGSGGLEEPEVGCYLMDFNENGLPTKIKINGYTIIDSNQYEQYSDCYIQPLLNGLHSPIHLAYLLCTESQYPSHNQDGESSSNGKNCR